MSKTGMHSPDWEQEEDSAVFQGIRNLSRVARTSARGLPSSKLHLGCGPIHLDGWTNIDILHTSATDYVDNIMTLTRVPDGFADEIYACHVLEHFSHVEVPIVLKRWHEILKPGGTLRISVPDIDKVVKIYVKNWQHFQTDGNSPWIGLIYGGQGDAYDFHKTGFNFCWMKHLLVGAGFPAAGIEEYPNEPHFVPGTVDASVDKKTFNDYISLNVVAGKA